jgi:hypothetical protein
MALDLQGIVQQILAKQTGAGKNGSWQKQDFIVETKDQYPKKVCFSAWGDKTSNLEKLKPGDEVTVSFNPESREFNGKWYTDLRAWKIESTSAVANGGASMPPMPPAPTSDDMPVFDSPVTDDDLPF